ncbi:MAG TPA: SDR family NAD(P)-dependent oxidoreductase [Dermatophilaceae bacterium]|nr:SDR family NAD(P)-dependent oxidoreductase [Dermatophilaceae bacterium]
MSRRVLVTGGASGLGLALARRFAARGDRVLAGDLADERPHPLPDGVDYIRLDVRSTQEWDAARALVQERWGGLDVLVNNAGVATGGRIDVESIADWERVLDVNLLGVVRGCQAFTPLFKRQHSGQIVNIASLAGLVHGPGMSSYNAAKAGVVALSETLDFELSPFGITTTVVCPAFFRTNLHTSLQGKDVEMERTAVHLITGAEADADTVAAEVVKGVDAGKRLILTDRLGRRAFWTKRLARPAYERSFRRGAEALARREGAPPADG